MNNRLFTFSLVSACVQSGLVRMVKGDASLSRMPWNEGSILGETISKQSLNERLRWGSMRACLLSPSPSCSTSIRGPRTRWNGKARQKVARPMRRSVGLVESERGALVEVVAGTFGRDEREGGDVFRMKKDRVVGAAQVGEGEGGDGEEEGEAVGDAVGVGVLESLSLCSVSSLGGKGVRGGASSTSTSEWKIRLATALINPGITNPTTGAGLKQ